MKLNQLRAFEKHIEAAAPNHFSSLYIILGKESFQRKIAIQKLIAALQGTTLQRDLEYQTFESDRLTAKDLVQELNAMALFSQKRAIILESAEKLNKESLSFLESYFAHPNPFVYLIISASMLSPSSNFYKKCEKKGIVLEFIEEKAWEKERSTQQWIIETLAKEKKSIDSNACAYLVKLLGTNQELLLSEMEKLICYIGSRPQISMTDINAIVSSIPQETIWQLGEAIFRRMGGAAIRIIKGLLLEDTSFFIIIRQLRSQFQTAFQVYSLLTAGGGSAEVSKQFPYMKGAILERQISFAQGYGLKGLKKGLIVIDEIEFQAKNSGMEIDFLSELLIVKLTSKFI